MDLRLCRTSILELMTWDPDQYLRFERERSLPFRHLVAAVDHLEPSHTILGELFSSPRWRDRLDGLPRTGVHEPRWYLDEFSGRGLEATVWQTTYFHVLEGEDPVLEWVRGTTLRPALERLDEVERQEFLSEYALQLREAYPARDGKTVFPFRRTFVVAFGGGLR